MHIIFYSWRGSHNIIYDDGSLLLGVDVDFPLSVNAANISLRDTVIFDGIDYDITKIEQRKPDIKDEDTKLELLELISQKKSLWR